MKPAPPKTWVATRVAVTADSSTPDTTTSGSSPADRSVDSRAGEADASTRRRGPAAVTATRVATQVFGGYGFMEEYPVARFYRDAKVLEIGEGTSEVQRILIARALGLPVH